MSVAIPTSDGFKEKAKVLRSFLLEKYKVEVSNGHSLEMVSKILGFKDWNTASAASNEKTLRPAVSGEIKTVGELISALKAYGESEPVEAMYEFKIGDLMEQIEDFDGPEDSISQEFSFTIGKVIEEIVTLKLKLTNEELHSEDGMHFRSLR